MAFKDVASSFPEDPNAQPVVFPPPPPPVAPLNHGPIANPGALQAPIPQPRITAVTLVRGALPAAVRPGFGLEAVDLAPIDPATGNAPGNNPFGTASASFSGNNAPAGNHIERFLVCPGDTTPCLARIDVTSIGPFGLRLQLTMANDDRVIWSRDLRQMDLGPFIVNPAPGPNQTRFEVPFSGRVDNPPHGSPGHDPTVTAQAPQGLFPDGWLTADKGPYRLAVTVILGVPPHEVWTYFHVPAHKWKLTGYTPSTGIGRFGLELALGRGEPLDLKVVANVFVGFEASWNNPMTGETTRTFSGPEMQQICDGFAERVFKAWSAKHTVTAGDRKLRPVFVLDVVHHREVSAETAPLPGVGVVVAAHLRQRAEATYPPYLFRVARQFAPDVSIPYLIKGKPGMSSLFPNAIGNWVGLAYPVALQDVETNPTNLSAAFNADMFRVCSAVQGAVRAAPITVSAEVVATEDNASGCTLTIKFPEHAIELDQDTRAWVSTLCGALAAVTEEISSPIELELTAFSKSKGSSRTKKAVASITRVLSAQLPLSQEDDRRAPPRQAPEMRDRRAGYRLKRDRYERDDDAARRRVELVIGRKPNSPAGTGTPDKHPYCAATHEFGHSIGLPDEYSCYQVPTNPSFVIAPSQPRMGRLGQVFNVPTPRYPALGEPEPKTSNLMGFGTVIQPAYYLPVMEGLAKLFALGPNLDALRLAAPPPTDGLRLADYNAPAHDPDFNTLKGALRAVADRFERGHTLMPAVNLLTQADLQADLRAQAQAAGIAALLYARVDDDDARVPALSRGCDRQLWLLKGAVLEGDTILHCAHQTEALRCSIALEPEPRSLKDTVFLPGMGSARVKLTLKAARQFNGTGKVVVSAGGIVTLWDAQNAGNAVTAATAFTAANLVNGVDIWAQGAGEGSVTVRLELEDATPTTVSRSAPVTLKCGRPVVLGTIGDAGFEPVGADGLFVPRAGVLNSTFPRTRLVLKRKLALTAAGRVRLRALGGGPGALQVYDAAAGGALQALPLTLVDADFVNEEKTLWLEGATTSGALRDTGLDLMAQFDDGSGGGFQDAGVCSTAPATVVELHDVAITVPATPRRTARNFARDPNAQPPRTMPQGVGAAAVCNPPRDHEVHPHVGYWNTAQPGNATRASYGTDDLAVNKPLVLVEGSLPPNGFVTLRAQVTQLVYPSLQWELERNPEDDERLERLVPGRELPTFRSQAPGVNGGHTEVAAELELDHVGSFRARLRASGQSLAVLNVVLVRAFSLSSDDATVARVPKRTAVTAVNAGDQTVELRTGDVNATLDVTPEKLACHLKGRVRFFGGGPDGRLGRDHVQAGWVQNLVSHAAWGKYVDAAHQRIVQLALANNAGQGVMLANHDTYFTSAAPARVPLDGSGGRGDDVLLDTGIRLPGSGGANAGLNRSRLGAVEDVEDLGWSRLVEAGDTCGTELFLRHPDHPAGLLTQVGYSHTFRSYLCAWTDAQGAAGPPRLKGAAAERLYGVVGDLSWGFRGEWDVTMRNPPAAPTAIPANSVKVEKARNTGDFDVLVQRPFTGKDKAVAAGGLVEVVEPTMLQCFCWEATW